MLFQKKQKWQKKGLQFSRVLDPEVEIAYIREQMRSVKTPQEEETKAMLKHQKIQKKLQLMIS